MRGITLHDKYTEDIIGSVLIHQDYDFADITNRWDEYQEDHNSNLEDEPDLYEFVSLNMDACEVLELEFYQP